MKDNKGIALLITMIFLSAVIATGLGVSVLILGETKISRYVDDSVFAIFAADAGLEKMLFFVSTGGDPASSPDFNYPSDPNALLSNGAKYYACAASQGCTNSIAKSRGEFNTTNRALQATYP